MDFIILPTYSGPAIPTFGSYHETLAKIGPAPEGWAYLNLGDKIPEESIILFEHKWQVARSTIHSKVNDSSWPHAVPTKPPKLSPLGQVKQVLHYHPSLAKEIIALALGKL